QRDDLVQRDVRAKRGGVAVADQLHEPAGRAPERGVQLVKVLSARRDGRVAPALDAGATGSILTSAAGSSSVSRYSRPSEPCRTSRIRWWRSRSNDSRRSSSHLSLNTIRWSCPLGATSPSRSPPTNALRFQPGKRTPLENLRPGAALDRPRKTPGCC